MSNAVEVIPLPSDPAKLTRELALKCAAHPEVLVEAFARLAAHAQQPTPQPSGVLAKAQANVT